VLIRLTAVEDGFAALDENARKAAIDQYKAALGAEYLAAYLKSLREKAKVKVNQELLYAKGQQ
jgi:hypothetical protein